MADATVKKLGRRPDRYDVVSLLDERNTTVVEGVASGNRSAVMEFAQVVEQRKPLPDWWTSAVIDQVMDIAGGILIALDGRKEAILAPSNERPLCNAHAGGSLLSIERGGHLNFFLVGTYLSGTVAVL